MKAQILNRWLVVGLTILPIAAHADWIDGSDVVDKVEELLAKTLVNPTLVSQDKIGYSLTAAQACALFFNESTTASHASECAALSSKFKTYQSVYDGSNAAPKGLVEWKYDGNLIASFYYSPQLSEVTLKFAEFRNAASGISAQTGDDLTELFSAIPSSGSILFAINRAIANSVEFKIAFDENINKSWGHAGTSISAGSFIKFLTTPSSHVVKVSTKLEDFVWDMKVSPTSVANWAADKFNGEISYNSQTGIIALKDFVIDDLNLKNDGVQILSLDIANPLSLSVDPLNFQYASESAVSIDLNVSRVLLNGVMPVGNYVYKNGEDNFVNYQSGSFAANLTDLFIKVPANAGVAGFFDGVTVLAADKLSGSLDIDASSGAVIEFHDIEVKNVDVAVDDDTLYTLNHLTGKADGHLIISDTEGHLVFNKAQDLRLTSNTNVIPSLPIGAYKFANAANTSIHNDVTAGVRVSYIVPSLEIKAPIDNQLVELKLTNSNGYYNFIDGSHPITLTGTIGTASLYQAGHKLALVTQNASSVISFNPSLDPIPLSVTNAVNFSISSASDVTGTGSAAISFGANTSMLLASNVTAGSLALMVNGYNKWFGAGAMMEGYDCNPASVGSCAAMITLAP